METKFVQVRDNMRTGPRLWNPEHQHRGARGKCDRFRVQPVNWRIDVMLAEIPDAPKLRIRPEIRQAAQLCWPTFNRLHTEDDVAARAVGKRRYVREELSLC